VQKQITQKKKAKEDADDLLKEKIALDKEFAEMGKRAAEEEKKMTAKAATIGNIVDKNCHVSSTEVRVTARGWVSLKCPVAHLLLCVTIRMRIPSPSSGIPRVPTTRAWIWSKKVSDLPTSPPTSSPTTKFSPDWMPLTPIEVPRLPVTEVSS
jgi:hypothetical protein